MAISSEIQAIPEIVGSSHSSKYTFTPALGTAPPRGFQIGRESLRQCVNSLRGADQGAERPEIEGMDGNSGRDKRRDYLGLRIGKVRTRSGSRARLTPPDAGSVSGIFAG
jgi:hypothetical protein